MEGFNHRILLDDDLDGCFGFMTSFRHTMSIIFNKQSIVQLTIFYSGTMNIYDAILEDKYQSIMLNHQFQS